MNARLSAAADKRNLRTTMYCLTEPQNMGIVKGKWELLGLIRATSVNETNVSVVVVQVFFFFPSLRSACSESTPALSLRKRCLRQQDVCPAIQLSTMTKKRLPTHFDNKFGRSKNGSSKHYRSEKPTAGISTAYWLNLDHLQQQPWKQKASLSKPNPCEVPTNMSFWNI